MSRQFDFTGSKLVDLQLVLGASNSHPVPSAAQVDASANEMSTRKPGTALTETTADATG